MSFYIDSEGRLSENKIPNYTIKTKLPDFDKIKKEISNNNKRIIIDTISTKDEE